MAKMRDSKGRPDENSGYVRVVGSLELGRLLSRLQATVIRNGNELERLLKSECPYYSAALTLGEIIETVNRKEVDNSKPLQAFFSYKHEREGEKGVIGDVIVVNHIEKSVYVIELKDGDTFDTKKASGEVASMKILSEALGAALGYTPKTRFCAFNQASKTAIVAGAKGRFDLETAMTGAELCQLLGVDYERMRQARKADEEENFDFLLREMLAIPAVRRKIESILAEESSGN